MLTSSRKTARGIVTSFVLAVVFLASAAAEEQALSSLETGLSELVYTASRSVVTIEATQAAAWGQSPSPGEEAVHRLVSSGIIVDSLGHVIVAASSVVGRELIYVSYEGRVFQAGLLGVDYQNGLAVLRTAPRLGQPAGMTEQAGCAGQIMIAMGNAYGISACPSLGFCAGLRPDGTLQFTAAVNPGMLGGGLFDLSGELVGVITGGIGSAKVPEAGLAVPARGIRNTLEYILKWGTRQAGYVGISTADIEVTPGIEIALQGGNQLASVGPLARHTVERGAVVTDVVARSPAWQAGLRPGDIIFSADGRSVESGLELMNAVLATAPRSAMTFGIIRQDRPYYVQVTVGHREIDTESVMHWAGPGSLARDPGAVDFLRREINRLRETLQELESQIERVDRLR